MEEKILLLRQKLIEELEKLEDGIVVRLDYSKELLEKILFICKDTFKEFALPKHVLGKIDFSNVCFDDFDAYRFCSTKEKPLHGIKLNPQTILGKNLNYSKLYGIEFIGPFDDCSIIGADFTGSKGAKIDPMKLNRIKFSKRYPFDDILDYEEISVSYCVFNGVTFIGVFKNYTEKIIENGKVKKMLDTTLKKPTLISIEGADFTGSMNAKINLSKVTAVYIRGKYVCGIIEKDIYQSLSGCKLANVRIRGSFENVDITGADFTGVKGDIFGDTIINPQIIYNKDLSNTKLSGVIFDGSFDGCNIGGADFTGSHNAIINIDKLETNSYKDTIFTDAKVIGERKLGLEIRGLLIDDKGKFDADLNAEINRLLGREHETELLRRKEIEVARKRLLEKNKRNLKEKIEELARLIESQASMGLEESRLYGFVTVNEELLLKSVDDHFEIDEEFIDVSLLRFFNLSNIEFTNVKVSGLDFRYSKARINPQTVYKKDISNCTFDSANIKFFDNYAGVIMRGTNFDECDFDAPKIR